MYVDVIEKENQPPTTRMKTGKMLQADQRCKKSLLSRKMAMKKKRENLWRVNVGDQLFRHFFPSKLNWSRCGWWWS